MLHAHASSGNRTRVMPIATTHAAAIYINEAQTRTKIARLTRNEAIPVKSAQPQHIFASSGNRTRGMSMATTYVAATPMMRTN